MPNETKPVLLTPELVSDLLRYDAATGDLIWKERPVSMFEGKRRPAPVLAAIWNTRQTGQKAGSRDGEGYLGVKLFDRQYLAHRLAWAIHYGKWPEHHIDHINHDRTDNRITNLRCVTLAENNRNRIRPCNNRSGYVGISWVAGRGAWLARIRRDKRNIHIGYFSDLTDAVAAHAETARRLGFHENHGKPAATQAEQSA